MESTLKRLFDYQKVEGNPALQSVIDSVHARYRRQELTLDEVENVAAAGITVKPADESERKGKL